MCNHVAENHQRISNSYTMCKNANQVCIRCNEHKNTIILCPKYIDYVKENCKMPIMWHPGSSVNSEGLDSYVEDFRTTIDYMYDLVLRKEYQDPNFICRVCRGNNSYYAFNLNKDVKRSATSHTTTEPCEHCMLNMV